MVNLILSIKTYNKFWHKNRKFMKIKLLYIQQIKFENRLNILNINVYYIQCFSYIINHYIVYHNF